MTIYIIGRKSLTNPLKLYGNILHNKLIKKDYDVKILDRFTIITPTKTDIVISFTANYDFSRIKPFYNIILWGSEYLSDDDKECILTFKDKIKYVITYNPHNNDFWESIIDKKYIQLTPFGYDSSFETIYDKSVKEKDIDILFYGILSDRRKELLDELRKDHVVHYTKKFKSIEEQCLYIKRSKIAIIIHGQDYNHIVDFARLSFLVANGAFILHENYDNLYKNYHKKEFKKYINTFKYNKAAKIVKSWLKKSQNKRDDKANDLYEWYKSTCNMDNLLSDTLLSIL